PAVVLPLQPQPLAGHGAVRQPGTLAQREATPIRRAKGLRPLGLPGRRSSRASGALLPASPPEGWRGRSPRSNTVGLRLVTTVLVALGMFPGTVGAAYEEAAVADGGVVSGVVKFVGTPPRLEPIAVNKNRDVCGDAKPSEALVVGAGGGVKGSVILIEGVTRGKKAKSDVVVDNHKCLFVSHVSATVPGERVRVKNSDPILHNTHGFLGKPTVFNLALPNKDQMIDITKRLTKPGVVRVLCDAHPHMFGWLVVHDSPYVAVTDDSGA